MADSRIYELSTVAFADDRELIHDKTGQLEAGRGRIDALRTQLFSFYWMPTTGVGDGVTDDGPAIAADLAALHAAGGGWLLLRRGKTYSVTTISISNIANVCIWGGPHAADGKGNARLKLRPYNGATSASRAQCPLVLIKASGVTIEGVDFDGSRGEHTGFNGTSATHAGFGNGSMNALALISCNEIVLCRVAGINANTDGLYISGARSWPPYTAGDASPPCRNIYAEDCVFNRSARNGWSVLTLRDALFYRCKFNDNGDLTAQSAGPAAGIDFEMDAGEEDASNAGTFMQMERVRLVECEFARNGSTGVIFSNRHAAKSSRLSLINCKGWGNGRFISSGFNALDVQIFGMPETVGTTVSAESFGVEIVGGEYRSQGIYVGTFDTLNTRQERFDCLIENVLLGGRAEIIIRQGRGNVTVLNNRWDRVRLVLSSVATAPPGSPAHGHIYIVPAGATGAWAGKEKLYAIWNADAAAWGFSAPVDGELAYSLDTGSGANNWLCYVDKPAGAIVYGSAASTGWELFPPFVSTADAIKIQNWWAGRIRVEGNHIVATGTNNAGIYVLADSTCATDVWIEKNTISNTTKRVLGTAYATGDTGHRGVRMDGNYRYVDLRYNHLWNCGTGLDLTANTYTRITVVENTYESNTTNGTLAATTTARTVTIRGERIIDGTAITNLPAAS
jgi:hypothetical protein